MAGGPTTAFGVAVDGLADRYERERVLRNAVTATELGLSPTVLLATVEQAARDGVDLATVEPAEGDVTGTGTTPLGSRLPGLELAELAELCLRHGMNHQAGALLERALDQPEDQPQTPAGAAPPPGGFDPRDLRPRWAWLAVAALDASAGEPADVEAAVLRATALCTDLEARADARRADQQLAGAAQGYYELAAAWDVAAHWEAGADAEGTVDPTLDGVDPERVEAAARDLERSATALEAAGECSWLRLEPTEGLVAAGAALDRRTSAEYLRSLCLRSPGPAVAAEGEPKTA
ncbi:MAG: hypothetical protein JWL73_2354 [Actinomycetia bacterium]|nr:hypothetical protein [Actinomycetes bacterium]